ncbi:archaetidylserine decarboxylase [Litorivicinus sp.]|jgi:phosphatidylserine decarboxylase|nr:archaetidylserine decarboxylase [Litorivicinus sp.]|tara:strand:+ start:7355 stop:8203 length:849 start_codon:yes stop_codon:yes gene_type:complete
MNLTQNVNTLIQQILPAHPLSRLAGKLALCENQQIKNFLIQKFIKHFNVSMDEVSDVSLDAYPHFNAFFTRALKQGARPMAGEGHIASPADGTIFGLGELSSNARLEAKGHKFSLAELLGTEEYDQTYKDGEFLTIYLSPRDYHRVHCPMKGELKQMTFIPGRLFSVNESTTTSIPAVFARNERVILHFKGEHGPFSMVLVGAMLVASIETTFAGVITPVGQSISHWNYHKGAHLKFEQGDEVGRFQYGSTVITILPSNTRGFAKNLKSEQSIRTGETLGQF